MQYFEGFSLRYDIIPIGRLIDLRLNFHVAFITQLIFRKISLGETKTFRHAFLIAP